MKKLIATINLTIDGYCDHTAVNPDDEVHEHYNELLRIAGTLLYGRTTYQLMESFWPTVVQTPTGNKALDDFAVLIDDVQKIVFSRTLKEVTWKNSTLKHAIDKEEILQLKREADKDLFVGSPSLIIALGNLGLIDEYQLMVHPVMAGSGKRLFQNYSERLELKLKKTKVFSGGAVCLFYEKI